MYVTLHVTVFSHVLQYSRLTLNTCEVFKKTQMHFPNNPLQMSILLCESTMALPLPEANQMTAVMTDDIQSSKW